MSFRATVESMSKIMDEMGITELNLERQFLFGLYRKHIHLSKQQAATVAVSAPSVETKKVGATCEDKINGCALKSPMVLRLVLGPNIQRQPLVILMRIH